MTIKNKMITEDYVSFETAKLLKEKGFNIRCQKAYWPDGSICNQAFSNAKEIIAYSRPTLPMAMKWLREVHNISIEPLVDFGSGDEYWWSADVAYIKKNGLIDTLTGYSSYEQVCEAAIKYCLENLI